MSEYSSPTGIKWQGKGYGTAEYGTDGQLIVMFYNRPVENAAKSLDAGRKICEDKDYVKIYHPGEGSTNMIDRPVNETDKRRFPRQWDMYIHNRTQMPEGTPVDLLFPNSPSQAENLKGMGVFTVEQAAGLSAHAQDRVGMGAQDIVNKAKMFIENANKGVSFHKQDNEIKKLRQDNKILQDQIVRLRTQVDSLIQKVSDPRGTSISPPWTGSDEQTQRINANHVTREMAKKKEVDVDSYGDPDLNI